jgi:catechol 2,3-dioxygenase-like lactoylglutathione lyase family enzyme
MRQALAHIALVVRDYDEAIAFYTQKLGFILLEDSYQPEQDKRWVVVAPANSGGSGIGGSSMGGSSMGGATILLARASKPEQEAFIGNQAGGRVFLFLQTDDFWRDYRAMLGKGVEFEREPKTVDYGTVAVFKDLYGNLWDLLEFAHDHPMRARLA